MINKDKDITRLINLPISKWKKNDWVTAAKFLASLKPKGLIISVWHESLRKVLSEYINDTTTTQRGRPKERPTVIPEKVLAIVERQRVKLAKKKNVKVSRITDKAVAMSFAEYKKKTSKTNDSKYELSRKYQNWIKYLKILVKTG